MYPMTTFFVINTTEGCIEMNTKILTITVAALFLSTPLLATASDCNYGHTTKKANYSKHKDSGGMLKVSAKSQPDIVDTAVSAGSFNTLVTAVKAAGLVATLKGNGPYTVFAPTDEAFAKVPADVLKGLLADKDALRKVLLYHVVPGKVTANQVVTLNSAPTAQGSQVMIDASNGVKVNNANVVKTDIMTSNGVIHVIDTVLLPQ